ncbi:MAG: alpha/beta hydrolase [Rhodobiaceae bacterium]|nr:alpha/beta hydrolase [Rhodobiaceae bacterium]
MVKTDGGEIAVHVSGDGPVILCVHGWPEHSWSWRHQIRFFAERGYQIAAMDVRGYGESTKPTAIDEYSLRKLAGDVATVAKSLSDDPVILFGHDWGAPIVYTTTLLHPEHVRAVAGLSVPFLPAGEVSMLDMLRQVYADRFFYMTYFQTPDVVEAEVAADVGAALRKIYYSLSGDAPLNDWLKEKPLTAGLLDELVDPRPFPDWLSDSDLKVYVDSFEKGGFRGPINRYRAMDLDHEDLVELRDRPIDVPACFIGGERDPIRNYIPEMDFYADPGAGCTDFRGTTLIPRAGHWVQQEEPDETNHALVRFLDDL